MTIFMLLSRADFDVDIKHEWWETKKMMMGFKEVEVEIDDSFTHEKDFFLILCWKIASNRKEGKKNYRIAYRMKAWEEVWMSSTSVSGDKRNREA